VAEFVVMLSAGQSTDQPTDQVAIY